MKKLFNIPSSLPHDCIVWYHYRYRTIVSCGTIVSSALPRELLAWAHSLILLLLFALLNFSVQAQLSISPSTTFDILQNAQLVSSDFINNNGAINNHGTIITKGDLLNTSDFTSNNNSKIIFSGNTPQSLESNTDPLLFYDAELNNPFGVYLSSDVYINNSFALSNGNVNTFNSASPQILNTLYFNTGASDPTEISSAYILGETVMSSRYLGTNALAFLGCNISNGSDDIGNIEITRITGPESIITVENSSIASNWTITSNNEPLSGREIQFSWFAGLDNEIDVTNAIAWTSTAPYETWSEIGEIQDVSASNPRNIAVNTTLFGKWTVSDNSIPLQLSTFDNNNISVFPNPVTNYLIIKIDNNKSNVYYKYILTDANLKIIDSGFIKNNETLIDMKFYNPSVYFLSIIKDNNPISIKKIIKTY